jgi:asparagine synthase (glutamine-hydrolysing)
MSAIVGIYYLDGRPVDRSDLKRMVEKLAHRGPDGEDIWHKGSVGFGHRMLWTTPESLKEKLPMVHKTKKFVITADARIDNRDELIVMLDLKDQPTGEITDSELILASYEKWDEACPEKLIGDFAFAIWDEHRRKLFCVRDHFGIKPFYYYASDRVFVFASEIKALLCLPEVPCQINDVRVAEYLGLLFNDTSITFYDGIFRLPPANSVTIHLNKIQTRCYWSLNPSNEIKLHSDEEYAEKFREIFTNAVRYRLRSKFPMGSMLSGGLDSSSIACVARDILAKNGGYRLSTFSAIYDKVTECDERPFINAVLYQNSFEPYYLQGDQRGPLSDLNIILWYQDEPFYAPHLFVTWDLYNFVYKRGIRITLDGFDGDTTISSSGLGYLHELASARHWLTLVATLKGVAKNWEVSFYRYLWTFTRHYGLNPIISRFPFLKSIRMLYKSLLGQKSRTQSGLTNREMWMAIINSNLIRQTDLEDRYQRWQQVKPSAARSEREEHYRDITSGFKSYALEVLDKTAAAFTIEARYPFWDKNLVEFCLALPPEQKLYRGWNRYLMRYAMTDILPMKVQWRRNKTDFSPNYLHGLLTYDRTLLDKVITNGMEILREYVNIPNLRKVYHRFISRRYRDKLQEIEDGFTIWKVVSLAIWLQNRCKATT